jgi:hypothetical protein
VDDLIVGFRGGSRPIIAVIEARLSQSPLTVNNN